MKMGFRVPATYKRSFRFALVVQLVALLLSACVDDHGSFMALVIAAWGGFWIGALAMMHNRQKPTAAELVFLRYGTLGIPMVIFTVAQYL